jgi:hypothetical protein
MRSGLSAGVRPNTHSRDLHAHTHTHTHTHIPFHSIPNRYIDNGDCSFRRSA